MFGWLLLSLGAIEFSQRTSNPRYVITWWSDLERHILGSSSGSLVRRRDGRLQDEVSTKRGKSVASTYLVLLNPFASAYRMCVSFIHDAPGYLQKTSQS